MRPVRHLPAVGMLLIAGALCGCSEVEEASSAGYEPAHVEAAEGAQRVTLTREAAERTGLRTAPVRREGEHRIVPYAALLYDGAGKSFVYTSPRRLTFQRADVDVARVVGDRVLLRSGPPAGSAVVTVGATEVYGAETGIAGGH